MVTIMIFLLFSILEVFVFSVVNGVAYIYGIETLQLCCN